MTAAAAGRRWQRGVFASTLVLVGAGLGLASPGAAMASGAAAAAVEDGAGPTADDNAGPLADHGAGPLAEGGPDRAAAPSHAPRRFKLGIELDANFRHSDDTRVAFHPAYLRAQETVDPGSHAEVSSVALLADYDPAPLWHAHLRFNGVNLYYRNPTSTDHQYDLAELWVRFGRETRTAVEPEQPGLYLKLGKFERPERQQDRHLQSYGLVGTAFDLFADAGLEAGADLGRHVFAKVVVSQGNPLFVRDTNALAGDTPELLEPYSEANLNGGLTILYDTHVERLDFAHPQYAGYLGWRLGDPAGASGLQLMAWGRRRKLAASVDLPGSSLGGDLETLQPLGAPIVVPLRGNGKQEVGGDLWLYHASGLSLFAEYVDQLVAGLGRTGIEAEAAWKIDLPLVWAARGRQLFAYAAPAVRWSKLHNRFYNNPPTPEPSLAWDWEKVDGGVRFGIWAEVDLTVEYSWNRTVVRPGVTENENELLGTLRIRL